MLSGPKAKTQELNPTVSHASLPPSMQTSSSSAFGFPATLSDRANVTCSSSLVADFVARALPQQPGLGHTLVSAGVKTMAELDELVNDDELLREVLGLLLETPARQINAYEYASLRNAVRKLSVPTRE